MNLSVLHTILVGSIFFEITIIICLASVLSIVFRLFKQPPILAYILTGILIGPFAQLQLAHFEQLKTLSQLGITLLLFMMGLEFKLKDLRSIGATAGVVGIGQIVFTSILGFFVARFLGFSAISSVYVSIALTFSSTIIIVKLLSDKKDLNSLFGKISVGLLLVQDFCAIGILMVLSSLGTSSQEFSILPFIIMFAKAILLFSVILYLGRTIFPKLIHAIARSDEVLFLFSLAWVFGLAGFISSPIIGFPIEIGGFLAGLALANSWENLQIASRVRGLRDFFITIFFVMLGLQMTFVGFSSFFIPIGIFILIVLLVKPLVVMILMGFMGYSKRTSFMTGVVTSQVSEFSLIIIFLGLKLHHIESPLVSALTLVAVITFGVSTYGILEGNKLYLKYGHYFNVFQWKSKKERLSLNLEEAFDFTNHVVLIGSNRMGESILDALILEGEKVIVIDFDPDVVERMKLQEVPSLFGDIADMDIQERANLEKAKLIISTVPDVDDNLILLRTVTEKQTNKKKIRVVVMAQEVADAKILYEAGADYVILPHLAGGRHLAKIIKDDSLADLEDFKKKDAKYLR